MVSATQRSWRIDNQRGLMSEFQRIHQRLQAKLDEQQGHDLDNGAQTIHDRPAPSIQSIIPPALSEICQVFGLSTFERDIILLCAGVELDSSFPGLCAALQGNPNQSYPTFGLAQLVLEHSHWGAFLSFGALRRWQIIQLAPGSTLFNSPLRLDERILSTMLGFSSLDDRLVPLLAPLEAPSFLVASHHQLAQDVVGVWRSQNFQGSLPILQLCGVDRETKLAIAAQVCSLLQLGAYTLSSKTLPTSTTELQEFTKLWEREVILRPVVMILDWDDVGNQDAARQNSVTLLLENLKSPLMIISRDRHAPVHRPIVTYDVDNPTHQEQTQLWRSILTAGDLTTETQLDDFTRRLATQFNLTVNQIRAASMAVNSSRSSSTSSDPSSSPSLNQTSNEQPVNGNGQTEKNSPFISLWNACRTQARPQLDDLAQRLPTKETWQDLVLPEAEHNVLKQIVAHVRQRDLVYEQWGFANRSSRGLGISALFAGVSGTGKTMAAGIIAKELQLDLYRIDLSSVVSKYIGETEKNLRRVFDAAETGSVVLLFDEADALFSKRNAVKDSHDRYANMEVSYLLQRMEAYRGLAILTTNLKDSIDPAFLRRIRFITRFKFPEFSERIKIWQRVFPSKLPTENLDYRKLAKLSIAGGNIRNIALTAAFLAADEQSSVQMKHLLDAAKSEFSKLERPIPPAEIRGWVKDD